MTPDQMYVFLVSMVVTIVLGFLFSLFGEYLAGRPFAHGVPAMTAIVSLTSALWGFSRFNLLAAVFLFLMAWVGWAVYCGLFPNRIVLTDSAAQELLRNIECLEDRMEHKHVGTLRQALALHDELENAQGSLWHFVLATSSPEADKPADVRDEEHLQFVSGLLNELARELNNPQTDNPVWQKQTLALIKDLYIRISWILE